MRTWLRHDGIYVSEKPDKYIIGWTNYPPNKPKEPIFNTDKYYYVKYNDTWSKWYRNEPKWEWTTLARAEREGYKVTKNKEYYFG